MSDETIREAAGHVTGAASMIERLAVEILAAFREGRFDPEPVGSPAYVRRLRDQAALRILQAMYSNPEMDRFGFGGYVQPEDMAVKDANKLVAVLGYQIPEDGEVKS